VIVAFFSICILLYASGLLFASKVWKTLPELDESGELKSVAILIPFRNEAENLNKLLASLGRLDYPVHLLEVILINDHSEDDFGEIIQSLDKTFPFNLSLINLPDHLRGKKSALIEGVEYTSAEIILSSDADCSFPSDWVQKMQAPFEISHIHLVSGSVVFSAHNFMSRLFQMEFAPLIGVGAISMELGNPTMANGANLAFRRSTFLSLNPYADNLSIPSGDDVFLLQKIKSRYPEGVFFQKNAVVETKAPQEFKAFFQQRKRWAAKWSSSANLVDTLPALAIWSFHLIYITAIVFSLISNEFLMLFPIIIFKILTEGIFIFLILKSQNQIFRMGYFTLLQLFYSLYVLIFGLIANFGSYTWKERKYRTNERARN